MSEVLDVWGPHSCATLKVTRTDFTMAIFNMGKLHFVLWAYCTSFCTSTGVTPYSLVYGMETVLPVEIEMSSLRIALEHQISEAEWAQKLRATNHVHAY
ncbi:hypothetical protein AAG906_038850 [Vitis piasezkii]